MKIVFVQRQTIWGGSVRSLYWLSSALAGEHEVYLAHFGDPTFAGAYAGAGIKLLPLGREPFELTALATNAVRLPLRRGVPTLLALPRLALDTVPVAAHVARLARDLKPDVIHVNESPRLNRAEILGGSLVGIPVVSHVRAIHRVTMADRRTVGRVAQIIAVSHAAARPFLEAGISSSRVEVIHNAVPLPEIPPARERLERRRSAGLDEGACWAVTSGRLTPWKGNIAAIRAVADVRRRGHDLRLLILGQGPERPSLEEEAQRLGVQESVTLAGWQDDPIGLVMLADIALVPSQQPDPFPRSVIEGMACGLPVVTTPLGGMAEAVADGVSGIVATGAGHEPLARALELLTADPDARARMGDAARSEVQRRFSVEAHVERVVAVYERVVRSHKRPRRARGVERTRLGDSA